MNNKKLGTEFEKETVEWLAKNGWWVHFLSPNASGAQPFDIIAVKKGRAIAIDCKTSVRATFPLSRLEDNQRLAFDRWMECGNETPYIFVKYEGEIYVVSYWLIKKYKKVDLKKEGLAWKSLLGIR